MFVRTLLRQRYQRRERYFWIRKKKDTRALNVTRGQICTYFHTNSSSSSTSSSSRCSRRVRGTKSRYYSSPSQRFFGEMGPFRRCGASTRMSRRASFLAGGCSSTRPRRMTSFLAGGCLLRRTRRAPRIIGGCSSVQKSRTATLLSIRSSFSTKSDGDGKSNNVDGSSSTRVPASAGDTVERRSPKSAVAKFAHQTSDDDVDGIANISSSSFEMKDVVAQIRRNPNVFFQELTEAMTDEEIRKWGGSFIVVGSQGNDTDEEEDKDDDWDEDEYEEADNRTHTDGLQSRQRNDEGTLPLGGVFSLRFRNRLNTEKDGREEGLSDADSVSSTTSQRRGNGMPRRHKRRDKKHKTSADRMRRRAALAAAEKLAIYEDEEYLHDLERTDIVNFYFGMHRDSGAQRGATTGSNVRVGRRDDDNSGGLYGVTSAATDQGVEEATVSSPDASAFASSSSQPLLQQHSRSSSFSVADVVSQALKRANSRSEDSKHARQMAEERQRMVRSDSVFGAHYGGVAPSNAAANGLVREEGNEGAGRMDSNGERASEDAESRLPAGITREQLVAVSLQGGIPFVVFGFIDNFIMILAGDAIDICFAHTLGLSMLACAGLGNMVSDVVGQTFGGVIEAMSTRLGLPDPKLTSDQRAHKLVKTTHVVSGTVGIGVGCLLGMVPLLFIDTSGSASHAAAAIVDAHVAIEGTASGGGGP